MRHADILPRALPISCRRGRAVTAHCDLAVGAQDLALLANGEAALWLPGASPVSVPFALEVIQRTLQSHRALFTQFAPFRYLLRERACPLVLKTMRQPSQEWQVALRLAHLTSSLLAGYTVALPAEVPRSDRT